MLFICFSSVLSVLSPVLHISVILNTGCLHLSNMDFLDCSDSFCQANVSAVQTVNTAISRQAFIFWDSPISFLKWRKCHIFPHKWHLGINKPPEETFSQLTHAADHLSFIMKCSDFLLPNKSQMGLFLFLYNERWATTKSCKQIQSLCSCTKWETSHHQSHNTVMLIKTRNGDNSTSLRFN